MSDDTRRPESMDNEAPPALEAEAARKGPLAWFAGHHVAANLLMIFIFALGGLALLDTTVEIFPEFSVDTITIRVPYLGASPSETEDGVVTRIEEAVASIQGIKELRATASEGFGLVTVEIEDGEDNRRVLDDVKAAVDRIDTFPEEIEEPIISEVQTRRQVISVVLHGDVGGGAANDGELANKILASLARDVRDDLTSLPDISQVELKGLPPYEISIEVSETELRRRGLTFDQVAGAVRRSSLDLPGGSLESAGGEILLRTQGQRYVGSEFEDIVVLTRGDGTQVYLRDVAEVRDAFENKPISVRFEGEPAVMVQVYRTGDEDAITVTDAVKAYVEQADLPPGVSVSLWQDSSQVLRERISLLIKNARLGIVLVFISLALFLDLRLAFWTTMGIPISFLGGLWLIPQFDVTINMVSLFAFIVSLGIVVDDAIIVGENIYARMEQGLKPLHAAVVGAREMAVPVTFAVMTSVAAFMPLVMVEGTMGKIMRNIPIVVIMVLLMSLIESLLILPAHLAGNQNREGKKPNALARALRPALRRIERVQSAFSKALERFVRTVYARSLERALEWRYATLSLALATLLLTGGLVGGGFLKFSFMPPVDAENMVAYLKMPQGTPVEQTAAIAQSIEDAARQVAAEFAEETPDDMPPLIQYVATAVGEQPSVGAGGPASTGSTSGSGSHLAEVNVELLPSAIRGVTADSLKGRWREIVGEVPGAVALTYTASLFSSGDPVSVQLAHKDFDTLLAAAERLKGMVAEYPGTFAVADSFEPGKKELELELTEQGRTLGLTLQDLARQVRQGFFGEEAQRIQRGRDDVRVMVRYPESERRSVGDLEDVRIRLADGTEVPFGTVAEAHEGRGFASINRVDRRRVVTVTADVDPDVANANEINDAMRAEALPSLMAEFPGLAFSFEGEQGDQQEALGSLGRNFLVALLAIFALLAVPFRSYSQPLIVMAAIPFGFVGAIWGHLAMGVALSLLSFFGIVALTGVVVNDSLIMVDLINRQRRDGVSLDVAIRESGKRRFRPILLTTVTTFMGLSPMILETSLQAQFLIPMAISLGFGIVFATAVTLIIVPVIYRILEDIHDLFGVESVHAPEESAETEEVGGSGVGDGSAEPALA